jgi:hypothetical protein
MQATFDEALVGLRSTGASTDIRELVELLARHGAEEGQLLATYENLASTTSNEGAKYLINIILDDERRHHRLLAEMANAMAWGSMRGAPGAATPGISQGIDKELSAHTKRLREAEEADFRELRRFRKRLRPFADTTSWALIIDLMLLDTKKHATILRFLENHARRR